ncbi:uncharacterized protein BDV17DRAFT_291008 [Aspergillus undulatus]|uniref:uncharacterized protein n=1 Tax=Aspergillus undulatus TaxID=1810928 RepID=UPI003CCD1D63
MNFTLPPFKSIRYVRADQKQLILHSPVLYATAVAHSKLEGGGNHWCFYLVIDEETSVRLDMTPSHSVGSTSIVGGFKVILGLTVAHFIRLLEGNKRHQYEFTSQGKGCRYWTDDQLSLFQMAGLATNPAQMAEAKAAILTQYPDQVQYPLVVGGYYV